MEILATAIGIAGVIINLIAYGMVTTGRMKASEVRYQIINILGTSGILISLTAQWNFASFVTNVAWLLIGVAGLVRIYCLRRA